MLGFNKTKEQKSKMIKLEKLSLEDKIEKAVSMFTSAVDQLEDVKNAAIADREKNNSRIAKLEADNTRLLGLESNINSKLEILKKLV